MRYGSLPTRVENIKVECNEMMFYQYLPIKLAGRGPEYILHENRLDCFTDLIFNAWYDFRLNFGIERLIASYIYLTAKSMFQLPGCAFNREGYHSDGFLTNDINYIWSDKNPTIFNSSRFNLTMNDEVSLKEMEEQALVENEVFYPNNTLLRLDQYNIHKVGPIKEIGVRTFIKISFSYDQYNLVGNAHNYLLDYNWEMKQRKIGRNVPQG